MKQERLDLDLRVQGYVSQIRSHASLRVGGMPASPTNREILARCVEAWLVLSEDLMLRQGIAPHARSQRMENMFSVLLDSDMVDIVSFLDAIYHRLITDSIPHPSQFKPVCDELTSDSRLDHKRLLSPVNLAIYSFLIETSDETKAHLLSSIAQFVRYPRKLEFQDIGLEQKALEEYLLTEQELDAVPQDDEERLSKTLEGVSQVIKDWFEDFHIENLLPKHGVGSVAEGPLSLCEKFQTMRVDGMVKTILNHSSGAYVYREYFPIPPEDGLERISRTIFVPKTATKLRTISMEPATLQYLQQGVMSELYRYIEHHPFLGVRIKLDDQGQNQVLALEGSMTHSYGTIDLSKASDSVSWNLVRRVFRSVPRLYKWLLATRSSSTLLPNGETIPLKKFAPMGSALCFPIECIIFAAIVEYASAAACKRLRIPKRVYSVYGDDLVVQSECYEDVIDALLLCGFHVNASKSYNVGRYRESCGKEYYAGFDISPLYYRIPFYRSKISPSAYSSWCGLANNAFLHHLPLLRLFAVRKVLESGRRRGPYFTVSPYVSPSLYSDQPTNFHVDWFWNADYQRLEGRFCTVKSRQRGGELTDDALAYFCKLVDLARRPRGRVTNDDESAPLYAMHGLIEFFSSINRPIRAYTIHQMDCTHDWSGTAFP